jgi:hypothetical protein
LKLIFCRERREEEERLKREEEERIRKEEERQKKEAEERFFILFKILIISERRAAEEKARKEAQEKARYLCTLYHLNFSSDKKTKKNQEKWQKKELNLLFKKDVMLQKEEPKNWKIF